MADTAGAGDPKNGSGQCLPDSGDQAVAYLLGVRFVALQFILEHSIF
jgi:hypothetical protein